MSLNNSNQLNTIVGKLNTANTANLKNMADVIEDSKKELYALFNTEI